MRYEIQTYTICDGWVNTWGIEQDNGESKPEYFDSYEDAIDALDDFFDEVHEAYQQGWIKTKYRPEEFRIVEIV
jgi:hypothetical protein